MLRRTATRPTLERLESRRLLDGMRFAAIGDYGYHLSTAAENVADMIDSWRPQFVVTLGDNTYTGNYELDVRQHYGEYLIPDENGQTRFHPAIGNHDLTVNGPREFLEFFGLDNAYYDLVLGPAHFFFVDGNPYDLYPVRDDPVQTAWLRQGLSASTAPFQFVLMHHPPFSSGNEHGSHPPLQLPYESWGADAVLAGHDHTYERLQVEGIPYFVDGLGGASRYAFRNPDDIEPQSRVRYNDNFGAMRVDIDWLAPGLLGATFEFFSVDGFSGALVDRFQVVRFATPGDVDLDGRTNAADIDAVFAAIARHDDHARYDVDLSGNVDEADLDMLVRNLVETAALDPLGRPLRGTVYGDANLDRRVDRHDLALVTRNLGYAGPPAWSRGDANGDGRVTLRDLMIVGAFFGAVDPAGSPALDDAAPDAVTDAPERPAARDLAAAAEAIHDGHPNASRNHVPARHVLAGRIRIDPPKPTRRRNVPVPALEPPTAQTSRPLRASRQISRMPTPSNATEL